MTRQILALFAAVSLMLGGVTGALAEQSPDAAKVQGTAASDLASQISAQPGQ